MVPAPHRNRLSQSLTSWKLCSTLVLDRTVYVLFGFRLSHAVNNRYPWLPAAPEIMFVAHHAASYVLIGVFCGTPWHTLTKINRANLMFFSLAGYSIIRAGSFPFDKAGLRYAGPINRPSPAWLVINKRASALVTVDARVNRGWSILQLADPPPRAGFDDAWDPVSRFRKRMYAAFKTRRHCGAW